MDFDYDLVIPKDRSFGSKVNGAWNGLVGDLTKGVIVTIFLPSSIIPETGHYIIYICTIVADKRESCIRHITRMFLRGSLAAKVFPMAFREKLLILQQRDYCSSDAVTLLYSCRRSGTLKMTVWRPLAKCIISYVNIFKISISMNIFMYLVILHQWIIHEFKILILFHY